MKNKPSLQFVLRVLIVASLFISGLIVYPSLPQVIPTHWDLNGNINGYSDKFFGVWIIPVLTLILTGVFAVLPRLDPKRENYKNFKASWDFMQTVIITFLGYIFALQLYFTVNPANSGMLFTQLMLGGMGGLFILLGLIMPQIEPNYFIGMRTPWTLHDPAVWKKSHVFTGKVFVIAGLLLLVDSFFGWFTIEVLLIMIALIVIAPISYSYFAHKQLSEHAKNN